MRKKKKKTLKRKLHPNESTIDKGKGELIGES